MKRCLFLLLLSVCIAQAMRAQAPLVKMWDKRFGGTYEDNLYLLQQTTDGGYILGGLSSSGIGGDKTQNAMNRDYWIVKIDAFGNKQWDKRFGGTYYDDFRWLQQTSDKGFILGGTSDSGASGDRTQPNWGGSVQDDYWIVKVDSSGNKQWDRRFGTLTNDFLTTLQQTTDHGYILGGYTDGEISGDKTQPTWGGSYSDYWILKIDSSGNLQWDKRFGGTEREWLSCVKQTRDKGYILGGYSQSGIGGDRTQDSKGVDDFWIVKIDSLGNKQWDKRYGGLYADKLYSVQLTKEGGYILAGNTNSYGSNIDYWAVKIDSLGNEQWRRNFGGNSSEELVSICQTVEGGFLLSGNSHSDVGGDKSENNLGLSQAWLVKINQNGNKQWDKTILTSGLDKSGYAIQAKDNCFIIGISSRSGVGAYKSQPNWDASGSSYDYWVIKFCDSTCFQLYASIQSSTVHVTCLGASDGAAKAVASGGTPPYTFLWSDGQADDSPIDLPAGAHSVTVTDANGCTATTSINIGEGAEPCVGIQEHSLSKIFLHPNPTNSTITLTASAIQTPAMLTLVDALGKAVLQQSAQPHELSNGVTLDMRALPEGVYFLHLFTASGSRVMKVVRY